MDHPSLPSRAELEQFYKSFIPVLNRKRLAGDSGWSEDFASIQTDKWEQGREFREFDVACS